VAGNSTAGMHCLSAAMHMIVKIGTLNWLILLILFVQNTPSFAKIITDKPDSCKNERTIQQHGKPPANSVYISVCACIAQQRL